MATTAHSTPSGGTEPGNAPALRLVTTRRRPLPSGRAVVGGLLVAIAVVGTFVLAGADGTPVTTYAVVARPVDAGAVLEPADLTTRPLTLDDAVARRAVADPASAVGAVARTALEPGDLLLASAVRPADAPAAGRLELTLVVPEGRVPPGLRRGEQVTLLATFGAGDGAATRPVLDRVEVVDIAVADGVAGRGETTLTVAVADPALAVAGAHAARVGELTVVRVQGTVGTFAGTSTAELLTPAPPAAAPPDAAAAGEAPPAPAPTAG